MAHIYGFKKDANRAIRLAFSILLGALILSFLLREISFSQVIAGFVAIQWRFYFIAAILYWGTIVLRAWRFHLIFEKKIALRRLLPIVLISNLFNVIIPFRLGELSFIHLVHKTDKVSLGKNIASILGARLLDAMSVIGIFVFLFLVVVRADTILEVAPLAVFVILIILGACFGVLVWRGEKATAAISFFLSRTGLDDTRVGRYIKYYIEEIVNGFAQFRGRKLLSNIAALSIIIWAVTLSSGFFLLRSVGIILDFWESAFVYSFPLFAAMLPFTGFGGFGTYEGPLAFALILFGVTGEVGIPSSIVLHFEELLLVIVLGLSGYMGLGMVRGSHSGSFKSTRSS